MGNEGKLAEDKGNEDGGKQDMCLVKVIGWRVEQVEVMKYFGAMITSDGNRSQDNYIVTNIMEGNWGLKL